MGFLISKIKHLNKQNRHTILNKNVNKISSYIELSWKNVKKKKKSYICAFIGQSNKVIGGGTHDNNNDWRGVYDNKMIGRRDKW